MLTIVKTNFAGIHHNERGYYIVNEHDEIVGSTTGYKTKLDATSAKRSINPNLQYMSYVPKKVRRF